MVDHGLSDAFRIPKDLDHRLQDAFWVSSSGFLLSLKLAGESELLKMDALTPFYRMKIEQLPSQERRVLQVLVDLGEPMRIKDLALYTRIGQHGHVSSIIHRLLRKGWVKRVPLQHSKRKGYVLNDEDPELVHFCYARWTDFPRIFTSPFSEELIPDRERPITYFIENRKEIERNWWRRKTTPLSV